MKHHCHHDVLCFKPPLHTKHYSVRSTMVYEALLCTKHEASLPLLYALFRSTTNHMGTTHHYTSHYSVPHNAVVYCALLCKTPLHTNQYSVRSTMVYEALLCTKHEASLPLLYKKHRYARSTKHHCHFCTALFRSTTNRVGTTRHCTIIILYRIMLSCTVRCCALLG